jgi:hypothetical protein
MPRKSKTESGKPAQPGPRIPPQTYGEGVEMNRMTANMPIPDRVTPALPPGPAAPLATGQEPPQPPQPPPDLMTLARQMPGGDGMLRMPSTRPQEPITAGLASGPGAGPELMGSPGQPRFVTLMQQLSAELGDPYYAELAMRASTPR